MMPSKARPEDEIEVEVNTETKEEPNHQTTSRSTPAQQRALKEFIKTRKPGVWKAMLDRFHATETAAVPEPAAASALASSSPAAAAVPPLTEAHSASTARDPFAGLEVVDKDNGPHLPFDEEEEKNTSKVDHAKDYFGQEPPDAVFDNAAYSSKVAASSNQLKSPNTLSPSTPSYMTKFKLVDDDAKVEKEKRKALEFSKKPRAKISGSFDLKNTSKVDHAKDYFGQVPPDAVFDNAAYSSKAAASSNELKSLNTLSPPTPFNMAEFGVVDDEAIVEKEMRKSLEFSKKPSAKTSGSSEFDEGESDDESIIGPPSEDMSDSLVLDTNGGNTPGRRGYNINADMNKRPAVVEDDVFHVSVDIDLHVDEEEGGNIMEKTSPSNTTAMPLLDEGTPEIPEAYLVEEGNDEVFLATHVEPPVPWWKQRRTKLLFGVVFFIVAALTIALGVSFSRIEPMLITEVMMVASSDAPSLSLSPSLLPSHNPTTTPSNVPSAIPTPVPSSSSGPSSSPTETCYWTDIAIVYDYFPEETSWEIHRVVGVGIDNELVKSHQGADGDRSHDESICLQEGEYIFTIFSQIFEFLYYDDDYVWDGHYTVTSNGAVIGEGGEFEDSESTSFSIPFDPSYPSMSPSSSPAPSTSSSPSMSPSSSLAPSTSSSPTETCYWTDIAIVYDDYPGETSWEIHRVVGVGIDNELVKFHQAGGFDTSHDESICLQEGEYVFTIYDYVGDGIFGPGYNGNDDYVGDGHYTVTSNGAVIKEGGEFEDEESTTFSIPFVLFA